MLWGLNKINTNYQALSARHSAVATSIILSFQRTPRMFWQSSHVSTAGESKFWEIRPKFFLKVSSGVGRGEQSFPDPYYQAVGTMAGGRWELANSWFGLWCCTFQMTRSWKPITGYKGWGALPDSAPEVGQGPGKVREHTWSLAPLRSKPGPAWINKWGRRVGIPFDVQIAL